LHCDVKNIFINARSNIYDAQDIHFTMPIVCNWQSAFPNMEVREDLFSRRFCRRSSATAPIGRRHKAEGPLLAQKLKSCHFQVMSALAPPIGAIAGLTS
jgi:hypothetical protein